MKLLTTVLLLGLTAPLAMASDITVDVEGKAVSVKATASGREILGKDLGTGDQKSPVGCSFLYYSRLAKGDIADASALSTDPQSTADKWIKYRARLGDNDFKRDMAAYFTSKNVIVTELSLGESVMLVVKTPDYTAGQMYVRRDGKWMVMEDPKSEAGKAFGKILSRIQDGELTF